MKGGSYRWTVTPETGVAVPPREEYFSDLNWLTAWPAGSMVVMVGHGGAPTYRATASAIIQGLAIGPFSRVRRTP
jgi:hypothetical protein